MSAPLSHTYKIRAFPERAITPEILYLDVGDEVPAAAVITPGGWLVTEFDTDTDVRLLDDEQAARDALVAIANGRVAAA